MTGYTKLFSSIIASTIWREDKETKIVWITILAMADKNGSVEASIPGLADMARVSVKECEKALKCLESSDPYSRTKEHEGRRIEPVDGGWLVLNHAKYREKMDDVERREYLRIKKQESRARLGQQSVNKCHEPSTESTQAEAEAEAEAQAQAFQPPSPRSASPQDVAFEEFWAQYPKKAGKGDAAKAFKKKKCAAILPQILSGVRLAKASHQWTKDGGQFIPNPATWLNREGWLDDPSTWPTNGSTPAAKRQEEKRAGEYPLHKCRPAWNPLDHPELLE